MKKPVNKVTGKTGHKRAKVPATICITGTINATVVNTPVAASTPSPKLKELVFWLGDLFLCMGSTNIYNVCPGVIALWADKPK